VSESQPERDDFGRFLPGNQAAVKHGAWSLARSSKVPSVRGVRSLRKDLERIKCDLEEITPRINVKKSLIISQIVRTEGMIRLIEMYLKKTGILKPDKFRSGILDLQPSLSKSYLALLNTQRQAILSLSLDEQKADEILAPYEIVGKEK
jgi:predicted DNA-binding protein YlxM (UPF0122 family)